MKRLMCVCIPIIIGCLMAGVMLRMAVKTGRAVAANETLGSIIVNTLSDELNNDGDCSLREALEAANTNTAVDACASGDVMTDTITFSVMGTITVSSQLGVTAGGALVIDGGDVITTSGGGTTRVWWVGIGSHFTLQNISIIDGNSEFHDGGGLYNDSGEVTIASSYFYSNTTLSVFGGAIRNNGVMTITTSTFSGNSAHNGGAISNDDLLYVSDSIFTGNTAYDSGGGISSDGAITVTGSTFSGNDAEVHGGGISYYLSLYLADTTFSENHSSMYAGAIFGSGRGILINCTFIDNYADEGIGAIGTTGDTSIFGSVFNSNSAMDVGAIYNNETMTITMSTISGNIADHSGGLGNAGNLTIDQTSIANNTAQYCGGLNNIGNLTILASDITDNFAWYDGGGICNTGILTIEDSTLDANRSMQSGGGVFSHGELTVKNSTLSTNDSEAGGGLFSEGNLYIADSSFYSNTASSAGGGVYGFTTTITHSIFAGNTVDWFGGGAISIYGPSTVTNSSFSDNSVEGYGGAIFIAGEATITLSTFSGNSAISGGGGALYTLFEPVTITKSTFTENVSPEGNGGAIYGVLLAINDSTINNNYAGSMGGGIFGITTTITNSTISGNSSNDWGGGILGITTTIGNSTIADNNTSSDGGGIYSYGTTVITNSIIAHNISGGDCFGVIADGGHNLDSDGTCGLDPAKGSLPNTDPLLGPLQTNGEPTWTHELLWTSPAIDAGDNDQCPGTDQRGVGRPLDGDNDGEAVCDMGAYEREYPAIPPDMILIAGPGEGYLGQTFPFTATVEPISTTLPITYTWMTTGQMPITHTSGISDTAYLTWNFTGTQTITVVASNGLGTVSDIHEINISEMPISGLTASNDSPTVIGEMTRFTATISGGTNVTFDWDFGDGTAGSGAEITHTYPAIGLFTVTVTATNSANTLSETTLVTITDIPISGLSAINNSPTMLGEITTFTATVSGGTNVSFDWEFGDGFTASGAVVVHVYGDAGSYTATVTATNTANSMTASTPVAVVSPVKRTYLPVVMKLEYTPSGEKRW